MNELYLQKLALQLSSASKSSWSSKSKSSSGSSLFADKNQSWKKVTEIKITRETILTRTRTWKSWNIRKFRRSRKQIKISQNSWWFWQCRKSQNDSTDRHQSDSRPNLTAVLDKTYLIKIHLQYYIIHKKQILI